MQMCLVTDYCMINITLWSTSNVSASFIEVGKELLVKSYVHQLIPHSTIRFQQNCHLKLPHGIHITSFCLLFTPTSATSDFHHYFAHSFFFLSFFFLMQYQFKDSW